MKKLLLLLLLANLFYFAWLLVRSPNSPILSTQSFDVLDQEIASLQEATQHGDIEGQRSFLAARASHARRSFEKLALYYKGLEIQLFTVFGLNGLGILLILLLGPQDNPTKD